MNWWVGKYACIFFIGLVIKCLSEEKNEHIIDFMYIYLCFSLWNLCIYIFLLVYISFCSHFGPSYLKLVGCCYHSAVYQSTSKYIHGIFSTCDFHEDDLGKRSLQKIVQENVGVMCRKKFMFNNGCCFLGSIFFFLFNMVLVTTTIHKHNKLVKGIC